MGLGWGYGDRDRGWIKRVNYCPSDRVMHTRSRNYGTEEKGYAAVYHFRLMTPYEKEIEKRKEKNIL
jgi:hypothetical protein